MIDFTERMFELEPINVEMCYTVNVRNDEELYHWKEQIKKHGYWMVLAEKYIDICVDKERVVFKYDIFPPSAALEFTHCQSCHREHKPKREIIK